MPPVRKSARVTVTDPVDGTVHRRYPDSRQSPGRLDYEVRVHRAVMAAAHAAMKPGQRLVIVDASTVYLVNA